MLDLVLIVLIIVSLSKPDILLSKDMKEKANEEQKKQLASNYRKLYSIVVASIESVALLRYNMILGAVCIIISFILLFAVAFPAKKKNKVILQELGLSK